MPFCASCNTTVPNKSWVGHFRSNLHKQNSYTIKHSDGVEIITSAFRNRIVTYKIVAIDDLQLGSLDRFFDEIRNKLKSLLDDFLTTHISAKVNFEHFATFLKFSDNSQAIKSFGTKNKILCSSYDFDILYIELLNYLKKSIEEFETRDSGWTFLNNLHLEVNLNKYQPIGGSSFIPLPRAIQLKKACLNIRNKDQCCFLWCVTAALYPARKHPERITSYPDYHEIFDISGMRFPVAFQDIKIFENNNKNIKFIIYGLYYRTSFDIIVLS